MAEDKIRVKLADQTGTVRTEAMVAANADVSRLIPLLMTALKLPATDRTGRPVSYHLAGDQNQELRAGDTLMSAGIAEGDVLTLVPDMTAGAAGDVDAGRRP